MPIFFHKEWTLTLKEIGGVPIVMLQFKAHHGSANRNNSEKIKLPIC